MSPSNKQIINLYIYSWKKEFPQTISNFVLKPKKFQGPYTNICSMYSQFFYGIPHFMKDYYKP